MSNVNVHKTLIMVLAVIFGSLSAVLSYVVANISTPHIATYKTFTATTPEVIVGGTLVIQATYEKNYDCGGVMIVTLDDSGPEGARVVFSQALGDRPVGEWSITRRIKIPSDAVPGAATVQESLAYTCGWKSETIRSPLIRVEIKEGP